MQVTSAPSFTAPIRANAAPPAPPSLNQDPVDNYEFTFPSFVAQAEEMPQSPPEENPPTLARPVLFVHGYNGAAENWQTFKDWLTRDDINKAGGLVKGDGTSRPDPTGKVFQMQFARPYNSCSTNARELEVAVDAICRATGASEIDIVAHSKGGLDSRLYVDKGDEKVNHLVMIGTPNRGTIMADMELRFREMGMPIFPNFQDPEVSQALRDLSVDRVNSHDQVNNPTVRDLNANLDRQKSRVEMMTVDGNGVPTLSDRSILTFRGDGVIPRHSVELPGVERSHKWWVNHTQVKNNPDVLRKTVAFLTDQPLPADEPEPPNVPPDQEIVPLKISADPEKLEYLVAETRPRV